MTAHLLLLRGLNSKQLPISVELAVFLLQGLQPLTSEAMGGGEQPRVRTGENHAFLRNDMK